MNVLDQIDALAHLPGPLYLAIGVFDGVHRGHQALIQSLLTRAAAQKGTSLVVTFEPHPLKVLRPETAPKVLTSPRHKLALLERHGVQNVLVISFTSAFAQTAPDHFIRSLHAAARPLALVAVGFRWEFGHRRSGNVALLEQLGHELGFDVLELESILEDGDPISSTRVRQAVRDGNLDNAARLLGRPFSLFGTVVRGQGLGRQLGFPTLNLDYEGEKVPPAGVYAGSCRWADERWPAAVNVGRRPTISEDGPLIVEAHLPGFSGDIYGATVELDLIRRLRDERRFPDLTSLREQIEEDIRQVTEPTFHPKTP